MDSQLNVTVMVFLFFVLLCFGFVCLFKFCFVFVAVLCWGLFGVGFVFLSKRV